MSDRIAVMQARHGFARRPDRAQEATQSRILALALAE